MKRSNFSAFTLMEIMVVVSILAIGLTPIFQSLSVSLNIFGTYSDFLNVSPWINEKIAETREALMLDGALNPGDVKGYAVIRQKDYEWIMSVDPLNLDDGLYRVSVDVSWKNGQRVRHLSRVAYVLQPMQYREKTETTVQ